MIFMQLTNLSTLVQLQHLITNKLIWAVISKRLRQQRPSVIAYEATHQTRRFGRQGKPNLQACVPLFISLCQKNFYNTTTLNMTR